MAGTVVPSDALRSGRDESCALSCVARGRAELKRLLRRPDSKKGGEEQGRARTAPPTAPSAGSAREHDELERILGQGGEPVAEGGRQVREWK